MFAPSATFHYCLVNRYSFIILFNCIDSVVLSSGICFLMSGCADADKAHKAISVTNSKLFWHVTKNSAFQGGLRIVKVDLDTEELIKDKDGYCIEVSHASTGTCEAATSTQ